MKPLVNIRCFVIYLVLVTLKIISHIFYSIKISWIGEKNKQSWQGVKLVFLLNHTSLFEFIYLGILPFPFLWKLSKHLTFPVADITFDRFFMGNFLKLLGPNVVRLTRKRDESWSHFIKHIGPETIIIFAPEGRMKRESGLDKFGNPMTVKSGTTDVLKLFTGHELMLIYSGGLGHVLPPGKRIPKIFKKLAVCMERIKIDDYLREFKNNKHEENVSKKISKNLEKRRDSHCPQL